MMQVDLPEGAITEENKAANQSKCTINEDGSYETPEELKSNYWYLSKLGEGTYGVVYEAKQIETGQIVAIKEIKIDHCDDGIPSTAIREIAVLQELRGSPYVVNLIQIIHGQKNNRLFLVFQYFNLDMKKYLDKQNEPFDAHKVRCILY